MLRIVARCVLLLGTSAAGVAVAAPPRPEGEARPPPPGPPLPFAACGLDPVPLAGTMEVQGAPVRAAIAWTEALPAAVLACERAHFEALPVDLQALPAALVVRDNLGGRTLLVSARAVAPGSTEVILAEQRGAPEGVVLPPGLDLPPALTVATRIDDRAAGDGAITLAGSCSGERPALLAALEAALVRGGWRRTARAPPEGTRVFGREGQLLVFALSPEGPCTFTLRLAGGAP